MDEKNVRQTDVPGEAGAGGAAIAGKRRDLPAAARRALQEAEERRAGAAGNKVREKEINGRDGPEPTRFGDWEKNGIAVDF